MTKTPMTYEVWLFASRRLRNPNQMGEHENSLRSLAWAGTAPDEARAVAKARRALGLALTAISTLTGKCLDLEALGVDYVINETDPSIGRAKIELGEVITEQLAAARKGTTTPETGAFDVTEVLECALRCMLADQDAPPESGTHVLSACVEWAEEPTEREVETSYAILGPSAEDDLEFRARPDHVETLQVLAAACRLTDARSDDEDRTEGTVTAPPSATLRTAFHNELRASRRADGKLPAAFLRRFGCEAEARIFEGAEKRP